MNMQNLMAQAKKIQGDIEKNQKEINVKIYEGKSEWVNVTMNGKREIKSLKINKTDLKGADDIEMLEDMAIIALNDALAQIANDIDQKLGMYGQGLSGLM